MIMQRGLALNTHMLYTFELTEPALAKITDYLLHCTDLHTDQYIMALEPHTHHNVIIVIIDCSPESATWIHLIT